MGRTHRDKSIAWLDLVNRRTEVKVCGREIHLPTLPQVNFNSKKLYLACVPLKKGCGRFYLPNAPKLHFGVSEFKLLTVGSIEKGF